MVWNFISPAPHPKYVHPSSTTINFSHLWVNGHFWQKKLKLPMCLMGAYTCPTSSEMELRYLKCVLMAFLIKKNFQKFSKFSPQNPKGKWPQVPFSRFCTFWAVSSVLEVLGRCIYHPFRLQTLLDTFRGCRRAPHDLRTPGTSVSIVTQKWTFCSIFFQARVPHGCTYFSAGCAPQKGRMGP